MDDIAAVAPPSSTMNQVPKKKQYLIAFNKFKKISFFGTCNVEINKTDKCLIFRTNSTEKKFQEFASTFNRIFVQKENALCIINAISNKDFIVIFPLKSTCDRIIEEINKAKYPSGPPTVDSKTDDILFKNNFYIPILKEIQATTTGYLEITTVVLDLVNKFEHDQRQTYMNIVFEILLSSADVNDAVIDDSDTVAVDNKTSDMNDETFDDSFNSTADHSTDNQSLNETIPSISNYSFHKRPAINYSSLNSSIHESNFGSSATKKTRDSSADNKEQKKSHPANTKMNIIKSPGFKISQFQRGDRICSKLIVFDPKDKNLCYEYGYQNSRNRYRCLGCRTKFQRYVYAKVIKNEEGAEDYVELGSNEHLCKPKKFVHDKTELVCIPKEAPKLRRIQNPNFKIHLVPNKYKREEFVKRLTIFDPAYGQRNFLYYYQQQHQKFYCKNCMHKSKKFVSAKLVKDENGEECIELSAVQHVCF